MRSVPFGGALGAAAAVALAVTVAAGSAPLRASTAPGAVPDQGYPLHPAGCQFAGWAPDDSTSIAAQTFTAGITGALTDVVIPLRGPNQNITVAIAGVDAAGMPISGTPLAT